LDFGSKGKSLVEDYTKKLYGGVEEKGNGTQGKGTSGWCMLKKVDAYFEGLIENSIEAE